MVTRAKYTYEDYLNTPEGERYELIDGELIRSLRPIWLTRRQEAICEPICICTRRKGNWEESFSSHST